MVSFMKVIVNMLILTDKYLSAILYGAIIIDCASSRISGQLHSLSSAKYMYTIYFANALSKKMYMTMLQMADCVCIFMFRLYAYVHCKLIEAIDRSEIAMFKRSKCSWTDETINQE